MKQKWYLGLALACTVALPTLASAQASDFLVRLRATRIIPADKSQANALVGLAEDDIQVSSKTIPEIDITYFLTNNIAAELVLTVPQKHDVSIKGVGKIGTFKHLPPTLLAQYHFAPKGQFNPYVGAGINYTRISSVDLGPLDLEKSSVGGALQIGMDIAIDKNWLVNIDAKYVQISSDVTVKGTSIKVSEVKVDPYLLSVGLGYRF